MPLSAHHEVTPKPPIAKQAADLLKKYGIVDGSTWLRKYNPQEIANALESGNNTQEVFADLWQALTEDGYDLEPHHEELFKKLLANFVFRLLAAWRPMLLPERLTDVQSMHEIMSHPHKLSRYFLNLNSPFANNPDAYLITFIIGLLFPTLIQLKQTRDDNSHTKYRNLLDELKGLFHRVPSSDWERILRLYQQKLQASKSNNN